MKPLFLFGLGALPLALSQSSTSQTNFFTIPGSQADQLASGNRTDQYPVYPEGRDTVFGFNTNWTLISLLLYQNENASYIRLLSFEENPSNTYTYDMNPDVDLSWNDVFFLTLWNENWDTEGGERFFSSSYFRINASDPTTTTTSTSTTTTSTSTSSSTSTDDPTTTPTSPGETTSPSPTDSSTSDSDSSSLSSSAKVGLGVGIGLGVPALALAGVAIFYYRRRSQAAAWQRQQQESPQTPQFPQYGPGAGGAYSHSSPPVSELGSSNINPSPWKLGAAQAQMGPSEVDAMGVHQPRFQELPAR
ncbi:hypothetical protein BJX99DRAFT_228261 [Aspergillus californicus]